MWGRINAHEKKVDYPFHIPLKVIRTSSMARLLRSLQRLLGPAELPVLPQTSNPYVTRSRSINTDFTVFQGTGNTPLRKAILLTTRRG